MSEVVLSLEKVGAHYSGIQALHNVTLEVRKGQVVALLGTNGAGKTTTLRAISGLLSPSSGSIRFLGAEISRTPAHKLPYLGLIHVPEGRRIFGGMSIRDNLILGSFSLSDDRERARRLDHVFSLFPVLSRRRDKDAAFLSGGEQQMLAVGRALMADPKLLLLDEPSMGLAPLMVKEIMRIIERLNQEGVTILLVEQNSRAALQVAHYAYVLETGNITLSGPASELAKDDAIVRAYLGASSPAPDPVGFIR